MQEKTSPTTVCALCQDRRQLCKSHIIPEFLYSAIYDDAGRIHLRSGDIATDNKLRQKGIWQYLLCQECETRISKWERYADHLFKGKRPEVTAVRTRDGLWLSGIDYTSMKLFLLSILWRAGVSTDGFFENVMLGPHEETLRGMLLRADPGAPTDYPCFTAMLMADGATVSDLIVQPTKTRVFDRSAYRFVFGGCVWAYCVARGIGVRGAEPFLSKDGVMPILVTDAREATFVAELVERVHRLGRGPE